MDEKTYLLIDIYNLFFRGVHATQANSIDEKVGLVLHTMFMMLKKAYTMFEPTRLVICAEGHNNWRKKIYPKYKANRQEKLDQRTPKEVEEDLALEKAFQELLSFFEQSTNVEFLRLAGFEADDMIARFVKLHPNDKKVIVSTDHDFVQLLNNHGTFIYNGIKEVLICDKGIVSTADNATKNKFVEFELKNDGKISVKDTLATPNTRIPRPDWIEYAKFCKCVRGDVSDNIMSAYPGCRQKSTKNKVGLNEAYDGRKTQDFNYVTFMNTTWEAPDGIHTVEKDVKFNETLIDMDKIPEEFTKQIDDFIINYPEKDITTNLTFNLKRLFGKYQLERLKDYYSVFVTMFSKK